MKKTAVLMVFMLVLSGMIIAGETRNNFGGFQRTNGFIEADDPTPEATPVQEHHKKEKTSVKAESYYQNATAQPSLEKTEKPTQSNIVTVNWMPQAGMNYSWRSDDQDADKKKPPIGFTGGVAAEVKLNSLFGVKASLGISQIVINDRFSSVTCDIYGTIITGSTWFETTIESYMAEVPVTGMVYFDPADFLQVFVGLGVVPSYVTYAINKFVTVPSLDGPKKTTSFEGIYKTGFTAECGIHLKAGIGKATAGIAYIIYPDDFGYLNEVKVTIGYLF